MPRLPHQIKRVNQLLSQSKLDAVRLSVQRGRPLGDPAWVEQVRSADGPGLYAPSTTSAPQTPLDSVELTPVLLQHGFRTE